MNEWKSLFEIENSTLLSMQLIKFYLVNSVCLIYMFSMKHKDTLDITNFLFLL